MAEIERRRRRLRPSAAASGPPPEPVPVQPEPPRPRPVGAAGGAEESERGLRGLVGSGSSQVSVTAAMRARDAARPSDEQLAEAESLIIVRRNWTPREELPRNR
jgi:hypothetical protein